MASNDSPGVKIPPPLIYLAGFLLGYVLERPFPARLAPANWSRGMAIVCFCAGVVLIVDFLLRFRRAGTTINPSGPATSLVTGGSFRYSRNPGYLGWGVLYLGATLWLNSLWPLALLPLVIFAVQGYAIHREERYLETKFGDEYRNYKARVRRWL